MARESLAILGVGFLGGSVALAARAAGIQRITGYDPRPEALAIAEQGGMLLPCIDLRSAVVGASLVVVAAPVDHIAAQVAEAAGHCSPGTLLTDVGSTEGLVRDLEDRIPAGRAFIGSHPLAGSEKSGPENARADLFRDRLVVLTPTESSPPTEVERLAQFWQSLGARVTVMTPEDHDRALAWTSHLPHLLAFALAGCLPREFLPLTATGYRDMTRLAGSDPALWRAIFEANRPALLAALAGYRAELDAMETALRGGATQPLLDLLARARAGRVT